MPALPMPSTTRWQRRQHCVPARLRNGQLQQRRGDRQNHRAEKCACTCNPRHLPGALSACRLPCPLSPRSVSLTQSRSTPAQAFEGQYELLAEAGTAAEQLGDKAQVWVGPSGWRLPVSSASSHLSAFVPDAAPP